MEVYPKLHLEPFIGLAAGEDTLLTYYVSKKKPLKHFEELKVLHLGPTFRKFIGQQKNWGFSRTVIALMNPIDKLFFSREIRLNAQAFQCFFLIMALLMFAVGFFYPTWFLLSLGFLVLYCSSAFTFMRFILTKKRGLRYLVFANCLLVIRNLCVCIGVSKGLSYFIRKRPFNFGNNAGN